MSGIEEVIKRLRSQLASVHEVRRRLTEGSQSYAVYLGRADAYMHAIEILSDLPTEQPEKPTTISLREYAAVEAMSAIISKIPAGAESRLGDTEQEERVARGAWYYADALVNMGDQDDAA